MLSTNNEIIYNYAKDVYEGKIEMNSAVETLKTEYLMNRTSAVHYINAYKCMRLGKVYKPAMNKDATKYFLEKIYQEEGKVELEKALRSVFAHLKYYESFPKHGKLRSIRKICEQYYEMINDDIMQ